MQTAIAALKPVGSIFSEEFIGKGSAQEYRYIALGELNGRRIRIDIRRDSYLSQSWARLDAWSNHDMRWNRLAEVPAESSAIESMHDPYSRHTEPQHTSCHRVAQLLIENALYTLGATK